ncbi:MAG: PIG-L family deacetylase [Gemmatimonadota bacterium]|nr:MAG: PIG-L family deacetylase [Gemmatimonadota bacterium]
MAVGRLLRGLGSAKRVLLIGAHPDDEDTSLLAWLERGRGADAAYLSLSRGEGGQNLIGPELGVGLGLVRTAELLAARELDGAEQFFTRAFDFGYSKSAEETFRFWPEDTLLADLVRVVRVFRPQVIVSTFSGTPRDGHGQHQVAGILAREAFDAAGDPQRYPQQIAEGLRPWTPLKLYRSTRFDPDATTLQIETGELDPLYGRSYHQIAMASRSRHRSQDMGRIESLGPQQTSLQLLESRVASDSTANETSMFDGVDTTLTGALTAFADTDLRRRLIRDLDAYAEAIAAARLAGPEAAQSEDLVAQLAEALWRLRRAMALAQDSPAAAEPIFVLEKQEEKLERALAEAAGIIVDAFGDDDLVVPGQDVEIEVQIWNGGGESIEVRRVELLSPAGRQDAATGPLSAGALSRRRFRLRIPASAVPTRAYFLRAPQTAGLYSWPADAAERGRPLGPPVIEVEVDVLVAGELVRRRVEAVYRFADQARGEVRRPIHVVPILSASLEPRVAVRPLGGEGSLRLTASLSTQSPGGVAGRLRLLVPDGWSVQPAEAELDLSESGSSASFDFAVEPRPDLQAGSYAISALVESADGGTYREGYTMIDYPHIRRSVLYRDAVANVNTFPLAVDRGRRVGYVPGAGDAMVGAIAALGLSADVLDERALAAGDLSDYDVVVLGIRSYETNPALAANNDRLMEWVRAGGTLVVQYQQYGYFNGDFAPYMLRARFPHDRVADESAAVTILNSEHRVFRYPNEIEADDFTGWVQERGLYFPHEWDERYEPLLAMADPGEDPKRGGLLVAEYGEGLYVYTGLSLFRQLPAGVPGAYRLLANLLSLGR